MPRYGDGSLCDVLPAAATVAGVRGFVDVFGLPPAPRVCVVLVDGLGWRLLRRHAGAAPFLAGMAGVPITAGFPTTTATSMVSLGTGLPPGRHGMVGYRVLVPELDACMSLLRWDLDVDPVRWQPNATVFERVDGAIPCFHVSPEAFRASGITLSGFRGARYVGAETPGDLVASAAEAFAATPRALGFMYYADLDKTGHLRGSLSVAWRHQLAVVDRMIELLATALPVGTLLLVTGDHGMTDVERDQRLDVAEFPAWSEGVRFLGGESRARHVYTEAGAALEVAARWRSLVDGRAWVATREEAIDRGWFGPIANTVAPRIGDVVVAARPGAAVSDVRQEPREVLMRGLHGSLSPDEMLVPLLVRVVS